MCSCLLHTWHGAVGVYGSTGVGWEVNSNTAKVKHVFLCASWFPDGHCGLGTSSGSDGDRVQEYRVPLYSCFPHRLLFILFLCLLLRVYQFHKMNWGALFFLCFATVYRTWELVFLYLELGQTLSLKMSFTALCPW